MKGSQSQRKRSGMRRGALRIVTETRPAHSVQQTYFLRASDPEEQRSAGDRNRRRGIGSANVRPTWIGSQGDGFLKDETRAVIPGNNHICSAASDTENRRNCAGRCNGVLEIYKHEVEIRVARGHNTFPAAAGIDITRFYDE